MDGTDAERRFITGTHVYGRAGLTSLSRTSIWRGVREGWFPPPVEVSPGRIAWYADEIESWIQSRPRKHGIPEALAS